MLVSTKGRYALRLMVMIAQKGVHGRVSLREASEDQDISLKYLEQLVRPLIAEGLIYSVRGKGGGYMLERPADEITAGDVLRAVEGTTAPAACGELEQPGTCPRASICTTVQFWKGLDKVIDNYVDGVTLADLAVLPCEIDLANSVTLS